MTLWVVKIGTSLLRGETTTTIDGYARCFAGAMDRGDQVVLVTSGAVGLGCQKLALSNRPDTVVALQAAAAIGQGALMALYERAMERHGRSVAQVLLTRSDLADRRRYQNASGTLRQLLSWGVLPVINENDALSPAPSSNESSSRGWRISEIGSALASTRGSEEYRRTLQQFSCRKKLGPLRQSLIGEKSENES